jgi:hypothetical protein
LHIFHTCILFAFDEFYFMELILLMSGISSKIMKVEDSIDFGDYGKLKLRNVIEIAATSSCRSHLEWFGQEFLHRHEMKQTCEKRLPYDAPMTAILHHFEECSDVKMDKSKLHGDALSGHLDNYDIRLPNSSSLAEIYQTFSRKIHSAELLVTEGGAVIVPSNLPSSMKRFWVRYLLASGHDVVMLDMDGNLREPLPDERETPGKKRRASVKEEG